MFSTLARPSLLHGFLLASSWFSLLFLQYIKSFPFFRPPRFPSLQATWCPKGWRCVMWTSPLSLPLLNVCFFSCFLLLPSHYRDDSFILRPILFVLAIPKPPDSCWILSLILSALSLISFSKTWEFLGCPLPLLTTPHLSPYQQFSFAAHS